MTAGCWDTANSRYRIAWTICAPIICFKEKNYDSLCKSSVVNSHLPVGYHSKIYWSYIIIRGISTSRSLGDLDPASCTIHCCFFSGVSKCQAGDEQFFVYRLVTIWLNIMTHKKTYKSYYHYYHIACNSFLAY